MKLKINGHGPALRCAIYARKSNEDSGRDEDKSIATQVAEAKKYIERKGWRWLSEHIYQDCAVSGGEFENRRDLIRLWAAIPKNGKPPFDVLVMRESSRFGRDSVRASYYKTNIIESGVAIWYYLPDRQELADTPQDRLMMHISGYADEDYRIKISENVREKMRLKHAAGHATGGRIYGYDHVWVLPNGQRKKPERGEAKPEKFPTEYAINEDEKEVVQAIYAMYRDGFGVIRIAKILNGDDRYKTILRKYLNGVSPPSPRNRTGSWAPSSVRNILINPRYLGKIPYGKISRVFRRGTAKRIKNGEPRFVVNRELRIVSDELFAEVQVRFKKAAKVYGFRDPNGRLYSSHAEGAGPEDTGRYSQYLLSGLVRCGSCGASMIGIKNQMGPRAKRVLVPVYICSWAQKRGAKACNVSHRERAEIFDEKVLSQIERILDAKVLEGVLKNALKHAKAAHKSNPNLGKQLDAEVKRLERERDNLLAALKAGTRKPQVVLDAIQATEDLLKQKQSERASVPGEQASTTDLDILKAQMEHRLGQFRRLMRANTGAARVVLRKLLNGHPLKAYWTNDGYKIRGGAWLTALLTPASDARQPGR